MIVDVNVNLSRWPTRRLPHDTTSQLAAKLREHRVQYAWASSFDSLLHRDIAAVNDRLAKDCGKSVLLPFGAINPALPDWREDLRRCVEVHQMPGVRLHPNYHGYRLDDSVFHELLRLCDNHKLVVQIAVKMEDERTQHPLMKTPSVDVMPLIDILKEFPRLPVVLLNSQRTLREEQWGELAAAGNVFFDISMLEGVAGIERMLNTVLHERILFGSHFPFFNFDSAMLKIRESTLAHFQREAILHANAIRLMSSRTRPERDQ